MMTLNNEYTFQTTAKTSSSSPYLEFIILLYKYGLPYLPMKSLCPNFFFVEKIMAGGYPTYQQYGHMHEIHFKYHGGEITHSIKSGDLSKNIS